MLLKKLEIAGFKSFAKPVTLEFLSSITAVVGPNGSGKSNVSEAIRWVLGEQSMKSLRGKRGEDLIFHGSGTASQLGKARVSIIFDNTKRIIPMDFSEVVISREVYRDGANEYKVNGSLVRLKDVVELMSHVGIGGSGHHIISQGEADRILYATPRERRMMLEDALGLRIYEIKRAEAERKLAATRENMNEVGTLRKEIQPHIKFLSSQVAKMKASAELRDELRGRMVEYFSRETSTIRRLQKEAEHKVAREREELAHIEKEVAELRSTRSGGTILPHAQSAKLEHLALEIEEMEKKRRSLERDLGRLEGELAVVEKGTSRKTGEVHVRAHTLEPVLQSLLQTIISIDTISTLEEARGLAERMKKEVESLLSLCRNEDAEKINTEGLDALYKERENLTELLQMTEKEKQDISGKKRVEEERREKERMSFFEGEKTLREREEEMYFLKDKLRGFDLESERILLRREELEREEADTRHIISDAPIPEDGETWNDRERDEAGRRIQRLRVKIEEVGGIDPSVSKEYEEISTRDEFLSKELGDLERTSSSLEEVMQELDKHLKKEFTEGIDKITMEFSRLFQDMFGGGKAALRFVELRKKHKEVDDGEESSFAPLSGASEDKEEEEAGIDISVDLPRKRVKSLDMLSGGERALTSIALLFAMSSVNPPPFLVLDETDAALDEANSQRYGAMLQTLSKKTQLVVITHNRQTMTEAGVLYGVTMGADGISRLLSLKFEEAAEMSGKQHENHES